MKINTLLALVLAACAAGHHVVQAGVNTGKGAGFVVSSGTFNAGTGLDISDGYLSTAGGSLTGSVASTTLMTVENPGTNFKAELIGSYDPSTEITLGDDGFLRLISGIADPIVVEGNARIEGSANVADGITINAEVLDEDITVSFSLDCELDGSIVVADTDHTVTIALADSLVFESGRVINTTAPVAGLGGAVLVDGSGNVLSFTNATFAANNEITFEATELELNGATTLSDVFSFDLTGGASSINANGGTITLAAGGQFAVDGNAAPLTIRNANIVTGAGVAPFAFANSATIKLENVTFDDTVYVREATLSAWTGTTLLSGTVPFGASAQVVLLADTAVTGSWSFGNGSLIDGNGYKLTTTSAANNVQLSAGTVHFRNVQIVTDGDGFHLNAFTANFSNVLFRVTEDYTVDKTAGDTIVVSGASTFVVDEHTITITANNGIQADAATIWYDTLDSDNAVPFYDGSDPVTTMVAVDAGRIVRTANGGQLRQVGSGGLNEGEIADYLTNNGYITTAAIADMVTEDGGADLSTYLDTGHYVADANYNAVFVSTSTSGATTYDGDITLANPGAILTINGNHTVSMSGRKMTFATGDTGVLVVADGATGVLDDARVINFSTAAVTYADVDSFLQIGNVVLELGSDQTFAKALTVYDGASATIDLQGHALTLTAALTVGAGETLRIKNGRLVGIDQISLGGTLILEDVEIGLTNSAGSAAANASFSTGTIQFQGDCSLTGVQAGGSLTLADGLTAATVLANSSLTVGVNQSLVYADTSSVVFSLAAVTSTLALAGGTLDVNDDLDLTTGRLVVDHTSTLDVANTKTLQLNDGSVNSTALQVELMPGATLTAIGLGTVAFGDADLDA